MLRLPLAERLKGRLQKAVALAQDLIVMAVYETYSDAVLHGGTAILRCYHGNRFSDDVDLYLPSAYRVQKLSELSARLERRGFVTAKLKTTKNSVFAKFTLQEAVVSVEGVRRRVSKTVLKAYETFDGAFMTVNTLTAEGLISEKVSAYLSRRRVRDLYDVFHLVNYVEEKEKARKSVAELLQAGREPVDEKMLKALLLSGSVPTYEGMIEGLRSWAR